MSDTAPARPLDGAEFDPGSVIAALGPSIAGLSCDSRTLAEGDAFIAYPGVSADGRKHIPQALAAGAAGVIWEASGFHWSQEWETPNIPVEDLRRRAGLIADCFYGKPSASMTTAAVTGTNGKTTTAYLAAQMLNMLGQNAVFVGTIGVGAPEALEPANITTPDAVSLQALLAHHRSRGAHAAVIEASSHGLAQDRLSGYRCDIAAFTNLGKDHICDHGSAEAYAAAKASLFDIPGVRVAVINIDDEFGQLLKKRLSGQLELLSYGTGDDADIRVTESTGGNVSVRVGGEEHFWQMPGPGIHNALNTAAATAIAHCAGHGWGEISRLIQESRLRMPPGRLEKVSEQPAVYVDYAHTAEALACALKTIRAAHPDARLTCVFGCGGDRDREQARTDGRDRGTARRHSHRHKRQPEIGKSGSNHRRSRGRRGNNRGSRRRSRRSDTARHFARGGQGRRARRGQRTRTVPGIRRREIAL